MKKTILPLLAFLLGIVICDFLFYEQSPGINALIFVPVVQTIIFLVGRNPFRNMKLTMVSIGLWVAGLSIALYDSDLSLLVYAGAFLIFLGFSLETELQSIFAAVVQAGFNFLTAPFTLIQEVSASIRPKRNLHKAWKWFKIILVPLILLFIFITIFRHSNPIFNQLFLNMDIYLNDLIEWLGRYFVLSHLTFLMFCGFLFTGIIYKGVHNFGLKMEHGKSDLLVRARRKSHSAFLFNNKLSALKDEYRIGLVVFIFMNLLLLIVNITEVLWLNGEYQQSAAALMSDKVHEGAGLLIFSMVLSIMVMLVLFRRNLNFYPGNLWLKRGAFIWILQNVMLGLNVALRNCYYISGYGLTYKRIGVYFFLLLVVTGFIFLYIKISRKTTTWQLAKSSAWSFYCAILLLAAINWDSIILSYNLRERAKNVDVEYLLSLRDRNIKQLYSAELNFRIQATDDSTMIRERLDAKARRLIELERLKEWPSRNLVSRKSYHYLLDKHPELFQQPATTR